MIKRVSKSKNKKGAEMCSPIIMIGDANPLNRKLLRDILSNKGYQVLEITNGKRVLDALINQKPDLAMLNSNIMGLSSQEVLSRIKKEKVLENLPVVVVGSWLQESVPIEGDAYFNQPISATQLCLTIDNLLAQYKKYASS